DINIPNMNGFETTRRILEIRSVPIVVVTASKDPKDVEHTFKAMEVGAVAVLEKPPGFGHPDFEKLSRKLAKTVKLMAEVKVVTRRPRSSSARQAASVSKASESPAKPASKIEMVAIGASTGGPVALHKILLGLPADFPAPILIVQHIAEGFNQGLVDWLNSSSKLNIHIGNNNEFIKPGNCYLAPDGFQMTVQKYGRIVLTTDPPEYGLRPSVSYMFRSVAAVYGARAVGVLLTGMGRDGAQELKLMRERGAITIAQDKATSVVHGMPGEAIKIGAARYVLPVDAIADKLKILVR
ncbi:MAG: chemotaxis protein CheB, partial [bacterium]